jgi:hypothetical protein
MGKVQVYTAQEVMPESKDAIKILTAKFSYDNAKATKTPAEFDTWINDKQNYFKCAPRGLAYSVSQKSHEAYKDTCKRKGWSEPKSPAPTALRYFILAIAIGWQELIDALKATLKYWGFSSDDLKQYAEQVWQVPANANKISQIIEQAQQANTIKLIEAIEKHDKLNSKLFTKDEELKERVRKKMLEIVDEFLANLKEQNIEIKINDILMVGSNASYNYTKDSDIDLHIMTDSKGIKYSTEVADALYSAYRSLFNKNLDISLYDIPLELYVETEKTPKNNSNGVYSVKKDKWVKKPVPENIPDYDKDALKELVDKWEKKCKDLLDKIAADKLDDEKQVVKLIEDIYDKLRKTGVAKSEYAIENLAFKELRNKGYLDKLKHSKHELISKRLSLEERFDRQARVDAYNQIAQAAGTQPIIQDNGMFFIYNLKESEISSKVQALQKLPIVKEVHASDSGKYDFSNVLHIATHNIPTKYYNIRGSLVNY